jgi:hypothetical protein
MTKNQGAAMIALLGFSLAVPAYADGGMWYVGVDMCGTGPNAAKCVNGIVTQPGYGLVSKEICEARAQDLADELRKLLFQIHRVWCEER